LKVRKELYPRLFTRRRGWNIQLTADATISSRIAMMIDEEDTQIEPPNTAGIYGNPGYKSMEMDDERGTKHADTLGCDSIC
jgi:hypothetical protein